MMYPHVVERSITVMHMNYMVEVPDACPICHHHGETQVVGAEGIDRGAYVQAIFRCAYDGCRQFFFCYYGPPTKSKLVAVRPVKPLVSTFPEAVSAISPTFLSVFAEAEEAAQLGLKQIAGPGYRKAFEFLIKDYAKSIAPDRALEIEKKFLISIFLSLPGRGTNQEHIRRQAGLRHCAQSCSVSERAQRSAVR